MKYQFNNHTENSKKWMVVYTRSRFEKKIDRSLKQLGINSFCPLVKTRHKWADRMKTVETPLFSSYLFVKIPPQEMEKIKQTSGVISFVSSNNKPVVLNDSEIDRIEHIVKTYQDVELVDMRHLNVGDTVQINDGILSNLTGTVRTITGKSVLMAVEQLNCVLVVKVAIDQIKLNMAS